MSLKTSLLGRFLGLILAFAIFLPVGAFANAGDWQAPGDSLALVRVDLAEEAELHSLGSQNLEVYARLYTQKGGLILVLPADEEAQRQLKRLGHPLKVLDPHVDANGYYLLYGLETDLGKAKAHVSILVQEGRQAIAKASIDQTWELAAMGLAVQPLSLHHILTTASQEAPTAPSITAADPLVQRMIDQVETAAIYNTVGELSGEWPVTIKDSPYTLVTRYTGNETATIKATRYVKEQFDAIGLPNGYHTYYSLYGWERRNVLAQQDGINQPNRILLLTAHLDSISPNPNYNAPGADDNASGTAGLLAIADILSQYPFDCSLRYALFTGEEYGMYGSAAYAAYVKGLGEDIEAVLNLDMIAYNTPGTQQSIELHTRPGNGADLAIANLFNNAVTNYQIGLQPNILQDGLSFSDHSSFWNNGYPAILAIEDWGDHTPSYHTISDRLGTLEMDYFTKFTKAALATFAHMGCMLSGELNGTVREAASGDPIPGAVIQVQGLDNLPWTVATQADGSFTLPLFQGSYDMTVSASAFAGASAADIAINHDQTTIQDFSLQELNLRVYIPLTLLNSAAR